MVWETFTNRQQVLLAILLADLAKVSGYVTMEKFEELIESKASICDSACLSMPDVLVLVFSSTVHGRLWVDCA